MKKYLVFISILMIIGCTNQRQEVRREVDIIIVASEKNKVRVTFLEHNLLRTIYIENEVCLYEVGSAELIEEGGSVVMEPNSRC
ncbi:hypothetical protein ACPV47_21445 [Vibrio jasicida]|uniref:hypothetical protein n=1 Tax=Vibrio jasicida TaxID=766224 RepID=UPI0040697071